jgi:hypothetical protein
LWTLCQAGLEPRFSRSEPPTYKGLQAWATGVRLAYAFTLEIFIWKWALFSSKLWKKYWNFLIAFYKL